MLFSSIVFLSVFLPLLLLIYYCSGKGSRNVILLAASLFFYGWGEPRLLSVMILSILWNYAVGIAIGRTRRDIFRKFLLSLGIIADLLCLGYFKYMDFFLENVNHLFHTDLRLLHIVMPIGISFYTFQAISYLVDVYRKEVEAEKNVLNAGLYISFFPQLIAGPIVKFHEIAGQIRDRKENLPEFSAGLQRFIEGLAKKVLIANIMGEMADTVFSRQAATLSFSDAWIGAVAYSMQIFFDFSGYSDMAIGLGRMFGFRIPENFNYPYVSATVTEFWRRWHISLSTWFKEYLYIPLGGSRCSKLATLRNLLIVFAVTGIWHGAGWTFLAWGLWHGSFILLERIFGLNKKVLPGFVRIFMHFYLLLVVLIGWVFFRADDFSYAFTYLERMFSAKGHVPATVMVTPLFLTILAVGLFFSTDLPRRIYDRFRDDPIFRIVWKFVCLVLLYLVFVRLAASSYNPFIYFRF